MKPPEILAQHHAILEDWAAWLRLAQHHAASIKDHRQKLTPFLCFIAERGLTLDETDGRTIADYQAHNFESISAKTGKPLSCSSQINRLTALKNFFRFLYRSGKIHLDPCHVIVLPKHQKLLPPVLLKPDEIRRLLAAPDLHNPLGFRDRTILETFYATGLRLSELLSLAVTDLNFEENLIHIRHGKGERPRLVPLGSHCRQWLESYLQNARPILLRGSTSQHIFLNRFAKPLDKNGWQKKLCELVKITRINPKFSTHGFRHMLATSMLERGADIRHVQEILGHENLTTTQRYLHIAKGELKKVHTRSHPRETAAKQYGHA